MVPHSEAAGLINVAVVGAHLRGFPLNGDLVARGAVFKYQTKTSAAYQLFALANTEPRKPGLCLAPPGQAGGEIEVEVWQMPVAEYAGFEASIPFPLGLGPVEMKDGTRVNCFIVDPSGLEGATNITHFGGWRAYMSSSG